MGRKAKQKKWFTVQFTWRASSNSNNMWRYNICNVTQRGISIIIHFFIHKMSFLLKGKISKSKAIVFFVEKISWFYFVWFEKDFLTNIKRAMKRLKSDFDNKFKNLHSLRFLPHDVRQVVNFWCIYNCDEQSSWRWLITSRWVFSSNVRIHNVQHHTDPRTGWHHNGLNNRNRSCSTVERVVCTGLFWLLALEIDN